MKLQAQSSRALHAALNKSAKCIASKNTMAILDNVLLSQNAEGKFFFTSTTTDSQLTIPAPLSVVEGKFDKPIALPVQTISKFLSTLPDCTITFDFIDDKNVSLEYCTTIGDKTKSGKVSMVYFKGEDFPKMAKPTVDTLHISLPGSLFINAIEQARSFCDAGELRPVMSAMCIDVVEDLSEVIFVATTGHILYKQVVSNDPARGGCDFYRGGTGSKALLHASYFRTLAVLAGLEQIDVESDGYTIRISSGDTEFMCKALEGRYPNYNSVIPRNNPYAICFDKKEMLSVVKRVAMFSSESSNLVELKKDGMFLRVSAQDIDFGLSADDQVIITDANLPDNFRIGFRASAMIDSINAIEGDSIRMTLADPSRVGVITADEPSPSVLTLLTPVLLND